jgi:chemotaxis methyl-accepting protein methylase
MMKSVYRGENRGKTLFGKCMEKYFVSVPEAQAVRNRGLYLLEKIKSTAEGPARPIKFMSVACGPAMEVQLLMKSHAEMLHENVEFHFVDQDIEALKECQRAIGHIARQTDAKCKFFFHNWAIKNIIENGLPQKGFDLIYSAGLFDYLSDPVAQFAARQLYSALKNQGQLIIGNFDISAPNRFGMSLVTDWNLIYRTREDMSRLFSPVGNVAVEKEQLGINLFAVLNKE